MTKRAPAKDELQPKTFKFSKVNEAKAKEQIKKYPNGRQASAVISLLYLAQEQEGWISRAAMGHIGEILNMPFIRVFEVVTFYTMFNLSPIGKYHIQLCGTTPCWLKGSDEILKACEKKLGIKKGEVTQDGQFGLIEVECLGACVNAPVVQLNDDYHEDLTPEKMTQLIEGCQHA